MFICLVISLFSPQNSIEMDNCSFKKYLSDNWHPLVEWTNVCIPKNSRAWDVTFFIPSLREKNLLTPPEEDTVWGCWPDPSPPVASPLLKFCPGFIWGANNLTIEGGSLAPNSLLWDAHFCPSIHTPTRLLLQDLIVTEEGWHFHSSIWKQTRRPKG